MTATSRPRLLIGVLTFQRPESVVRLVPQLLEQCADAADLVEAGVLVVDNDPAAASRNLLTGLDVRYVHEPTPGIAAARHRALEEADGVDLLQFIDDDELPQPGWLRAMVSAWMEHGQPAAVAGVVLTRFVESPDPWIVEGGFFDRHRPRTGTLMTSAATNNLLIDVAQARSLGVQFDLRLGLRGGEDSLFTRQLVARGGRIIACREGAVTDLVTPERATRAWVTARSFHHGGTATYLDLMTSPDPASRARILVRRGAGGLVRALVGQLWTWMGTIRREPRLEGRGLKMRARGLGMAKAVFSTIPPEYRR